MNNSLDINVYLVNEILSLACLIYDCNKKKFDSSIKKRDVIIIS